MATQTEFQENIIQHENCQQKVKFESPLVNPISNLERLLQDILRKCKYIVIKCHNTPGEYDSGSCDINLPSCGGGLTQEW